MGYLNKYFNLLKGPFGYILTSKITVNHHLGQK